jgi:cytochrome c556
MVVGMKDNQEIAREQRMKETNDAYMNKTSWGKVADPYDDVTETFKALLAVITLTAAVTLLAFVIWGK